MDITQIKVFGERNTGTNWLENLLMQNYDAPVIHHRGIISQEMTDLERKFLASLPRVQQLFMEEKIKDAIFETKGSKLFGWKHSSVLSENINKHPKFNETGFIFLVKNPFSFIKSLHKRPYNTLINVPKKVDDFIITPWPTLHRDYTCSPLLETPVELWNYKVSSYCNFLDSHKNALLLRYESLLENHELLFSLVEEKFKLKPKTRLPILKSTKFDKLNTDDYRNKYLNTNPSSGLRLNSIDLINSVLDDRLVKRCQYDSSH